LRRTPPSHPSWRDRPVATRTLAGAVYVLLDLRKAPCDICRYGERFDTTWGSAAGDANHITWCRSCFNAEFDRAELDERLEPEWRRRVERAVADPTLHCWSGARPAVEDLERRGLV
jgi:hypothetical protein